MTGLGLSGRRVAIAGQESHETNDIEYCEKKHNLGDCWYSNHQACSGDRE